MYAGSSRRDRRQLRVREQPGSAVMNPVFEAADVIVQNFTLVDRRPTGMATRMDSRTTTRW